EVSASHHRHLARQLRKLGLDGDAPPDAETWRVFLDGVSCSYDDADRERYTLERSVNLFETEMRELNAKLEAERDHMRLLFDAAPVAIIRTELDGRITMVNPAFERILGYAPDELRALGRFDLVHPEDRALAERQIDALNAGQLGIGYHAQRRFVAKGGATVYTNLAVSLVADKERRPLFVISVIEDISERIRLEIELRHAQKLESIGRLASGIAHEINTPIQYVGDRATFLKGAFSDLMGLCEFYRGLLERHAAALPAEGREAIQTAEEAADLEYLRAHTPSAFAEALDGVRRLATIVRAMKTFAHQDRGEKNAADLNAALRSTLTVAANELKYQARVETCLGDIPPVPCHLSDLNQVFLNLLVNAADAIGGARRPDGALGTITVSTYLEGSSVVISIADTGAGIPDAIRDRIFEPFFTTKEVGRGTGQGLAISRSIVTEKHGGSLTFQSTPGAGTTFYVRLPLGVAERESSVVA